MDDQLPRPRDAADLIASSLARVGGGFGAIIAAWERAVGAQLAQVATPAKLEGGELRIRCSSSAWASEVALMQAELIDRLNRELGASLVTSIRTRAGRPASPSPPVVAATPPPPLAPLDPATRARAAGVAEAIPAGPLRDRVQAAIEATARRRAIP